MLFIGIKLGTAEDGKVTFIVKERLKVPTEETRWKMKHKKQYRSSLIKAKGKKEDK